uniref:VAN3-binding protein-like auxin canalisation domain-containing protein n=1 Tax=Setaria digitata TaxID=48799 RepID=A0A915PGA4_9BILA
MEISLANLSISASVIKATITASHEVVSPTAATFATTERVHATSPTDKISVRDNDNDSGMDPTLEQFSAANLQSSSLNNDEKLSNEKISITKLQLAQVTNSLLEPIIHLATTTMISSAHNADKTEANFTKFNLFETTQRIPELQLTMNNTSPIITYNHLAPKTRLDQWEQKENFKQEQQTNWISDSDKNDSADDNDHDHGNSDINNYDNTNRSRSVKLSFNFSIFLFSLLSHLFLLSFLQNHY